MFHLFFRFLCALFFLLIAIAPGLCETTALSSSTTRTHAFKPTSLPKQLLPELSDADLEKQPITRWFRVQDEFQTQYTAIESRHAEQSRLLDQLEILRRDSKKNTLLQVPLTGKSQELLRSLHLAQQGIEDVLKSLDSVGAQIAPHLPKIYIQLQELQETWRKKQKDASTTEAKALTARLVAVLDDNLNLVEDVQTAPENVDEKLLRYVERKAAATPESPRNLSYRRLQERTEKLEREQWLIEQRLEENKRELATIQAEIERVLKTQTKVRPVDEEVTPKPRPVPPKL